MAFWKKENNINENKEEESFIVKNEEKEKEKSSFQYKEPQLTQPVRSALGAGTVIQGKLSFDMPVSIDGKLAGELFSSESVIIGKSGIVEAEIDVKELIIYGYIKGNIKATQKIKIFSGASVEGSITTPSLSIEEGAIMNCQCMMSKDSKDQNDTLNKNSPMNNSLYKTKK